MNRTMEHYFLCPKCRIKTLLPVCNNCGYKIPLINSIYRFCNDTSVKLEGEKQYIGYAILAKILNLRLHIGTQTTAKDTAFMPPAPILLASSSARIFACLILAPGSERLLFRSRKTEYSPSRQTFQQLC